MANYLGIDTSNYTTSLAIYNSKNKTVLQQKQLLEVKENNKGLRQSDALFLHTKNLPQIFNNLFDGKSIPINGVGVSAVPRDVKNSYMPCFLAGVASANAISAANNIPLHKFSHQRGHIVAALYSANCLHYLKNQFIAFHISGGTTELLHITPDNQDIIKCKILASAKDINAGQLIDRVGVMLGLKFPCGKELELLATKGKSPKKYSVPIIDGCPSFSGVENICLKLFNDGINKEDIAYFTLDVISNTVVKMTEYALSVCGNLPIVYAGGVMSDKIIQNKILSNFNAAFAKPEFSCDNAAGIALLTAIKEGEKLYE